MTDCHVTLIPGSGIHVCVKFTNINLMPVGKNGLSRGNENGGKGLLDPTIGGGGGGGRVHGNHGVLGMDA